MDNSTNFQDIAKYCKDEFEQKIEKASNKTSYTILYVAINEDGQLRISKTPHILSGATVCYLIHSWSQLAVSCWYDTYSVQSINKNGEVGEGQFDEEYSFFISAASFNCSPRIFFQRNGNKLYSAKLWESGRTTEQVLTRQLMFIWELYNKCKESCTSMYESQLYCKLAEKEGAIKDLEEKLKESTIKEQYLESEISQYRSILNEVKSLMETK